MKMNTYSQTCFDLCQEEFQEGELTKTLSKTVWQKQH